MVKRGKWGSKIGFIFAAAGSAVGLGNIWRFPYKVAEGGGALFVLIYLASILLIALPVLLAEISLGRSTGKNPVGAFEAIRPKSGWKGIGFLGVLTGVMIFSFYSVVAGWTVGYFYKAVTGKLTDISSTAAVDLFTAFTSNQLMQVVLTAMFIALTAWVVSRGVSGGIEKVAKILMPALFALLLLLVGRSLTLPNASEGLNFYLSPDFSKISIKVVIEAMGQAFFSLSLGMGTMITYGSYIGKKENLPSAAGWVAFFDTFIAILAGFIIFPAIFSVAGAAPGEAGAGLVFKILPVIFAQIPGGPIFGALFFLLLCIAALTSTISLLEVPVSYFLDERGWNRKKSTILVGSVTLLVAIPSALSEKFLDLWGFIWGDLSLGIGAFFIAVFVGYIWKTANTLKEIKQGTDEGKPFRFAKFWIISMKYISPIIIFLIFVGFILNKFELW